MIPNFIGMKFVVIVFLFFVSFSAFGQLTSSDRNQKKKVAILEVVDKEGTISYGVKLMLRSNLSVAVTNTSGYEGYDRVDIASIMGEQNFQRTGMVSDAQIKKLGEMTGASYILVAEAAALDANHLFITAKILEVESARLERTANVQSGTTVEEFEKACRQLALLLFNRALGSGASTFLRNSEEDGKDFIGNDIVFEDSSFSEALKKAKEEGKLLFVDCYTTWCVACRKMNEVFMQKEVVYYFNTHFISLKMDMEKGEGPELKEKYGVEAYPTMFVLNTEGLIIGKLVGSCDMITFMEKIRTFVNKYQKEKLE